jgi:hypothetical protein
MLHKGENMRIEKHFVTFLSPGIFFNETTTKEIDSWDVNKALEMSRNIVERYDATPYAFYFTTRARDDFDLDSKQVAESAMYYLGGEVKTLKQIELECDSNNDILLQNMRSNGYKKVIINSGSWKGVHPLGDNDIVLQY